MNVIKAQAVCVSPLPYLGAPAADSFAGGVYVRLVAEEQVATVEAQ